MRTKGVDRRISWRHNGAMKEANHTNVADLDRINLRLSAATFQAIDGARSARPGRVSRNTWIAEAIEEKLARDAITSSPQQFRDASNA